MPVKKKRSSTKKTTKATGRVRDYKREYQMYHASPEQKKKRAARNKARRIMSKAGRVHKGDGKDVDHKRSLKSGGSTTKSNLRVLSKSANRGRNSTNGGRPKGGSKKLPRYR